MRLFVMADKHTGAGLLFLFERRSPHCERFPCTLGSLAPCPALEFAHLRF